MKTAIEFIANRPWILIVFGFCVLVSVWAVFLTLAILNQPEKVGL